MPDAKAKRADPYKNFRFRVKFGGGLEYVLGVSKVVGFTKTGPKLPGGFEHHALILERGVTTDKAFEHWASSKDIRKNLIFDVYNEAGQKVLSYQVFNCWVSEFQPLADLDANANAVAIQHIRVENEGWVREDLP